LSPTALRGGGLGPCLVLGAVSAGKLGPAVDWDQQVPLSRAWLQRSRGGRWALSCRVTSRMAPVPLPLPGTGFPPSFASPWLSWTGLCSTGLSRGEKGERQGRISPGSAVPRGSPREQRSRRRYPVLKGR